LGLRALAGDRLDITLVTPELRFVNRSMAVDQPFRPQRPRGMRMQDVTAEHGASWHRGALDRVEHQRRVAVTKDGDELPYDRLVLALGARPNREWHADWVLTFHDGRDGPTYRLLLHQLREGRHKKVAFVKPAGATWPMPLYDLALMTAGDCAAHHRPDVELSLITPGGRAARHVRRSGQRRRRLAARGARGDRLREQLRRPRAPGMAQRLSGRLAAVGRSLVTVPRLVGPRLRGIACGREGFLRTDPHGRVPGLDRVYAAGDVTAFPIKHGGLAAQQADAVAEAVAASVGVGIEPQPFRPVLRAALLTGAGARFLRADISGRAGDDSAISAEPLWWPPNKLYGRYLAPYLSGHTGEAADVMPAPAQRAS
jgi:sulfide:quinone oxidoreductase